MTMNKFLTYNILGVDNLTALNFVCPKRKNSCNTCKPDPCFQTIVHITEDRQMSWKFKIPFISSLICW